MISENTKQKSGDSCEIQYESCDNSSGECFTDLKNNLLVKSANLKYCFEPIIENAQSSDPVAQLKMQGGVTDSNVWPWMYEIRGSRQGEEFFCTANQIRLNLLVTGKIYHILASYV